MRVNDTRAISFEQYPGREYLGDTGQLRIRGRLFLVGQRVYEVRAVTRTHPTREEVDAADRFLNSFALPPNILSGRVAIGQPIDVALKTVGHLPEPIDGIVTATLASGAWIKLRAVDIDHDQTAARRGRIVIKAMTSTQMITSAGRKYVNFTFGPTFVATAWFEDVDWDETRLLAERDYGPSFQFDTKGIDFGSWLRRVHAQVYGNWLIPYSAIALHGHTVLRFTIHKDGTIIGLAIQQPSSSDALNKAAFNAINASSPTVPLPADYPDEETAMTVIFYYNEKPPIDGGQITLKDPALK